MEQSEDLLLENDVRFVASHFLQDIYAENDELRKELEFRKKINIDDRKRIEELLYQISKLETNNEEVRDVSLGDQFYDEYLTDCLFSHQR